MIWRATSGSVGKPVFSLALTFALASPLAGCRAPAPSERAAEYSKEIEEHRADREERLRSEEGWLTLVGLFWLQHGENAFGSDPGNAIVLPQGSAPGRAGSFVYDGTRVLLVAEPGAGVTLDGQPVTRKELQDDTAESPDRLRLGRIRLHVIQRDGSHAIRAKDPESPVRTRFKGLDYFPIDPGYRIVGRFEPYADPREIRVPTVVGTAADMLVPGVVEFSVGGTPLTLHPLVGEPSETEFFFVFKDLTSGRETYAAGRYLYADLEDGQVVLDFNKAYNPPCVFTPFATCPLPPKENRLGLRIEAGEKVHGKQE
jgi:uncharacterized protein (DUF1684 family)